jgi:ABC-type sugar transport system ATPase subunit
MSERQAVSGQGLVLDGITHRFGSALAVDEVSLDIKAGELVALLGPSGCGKTTLLKIIAGFVRQSEGYVMIGDTVVDDLPPNRRTVGIVFQNYALFPHMTVAENVGYPRRRRFRCAIVSVSERQSHSGNPLLKHAPDIRCVIAQPVGWRQLFAVTFSEPPPSAAGGSDLDVAALGVTGSPVTPVSWNQIGRMVAAVPASVQKLSHGP